MLLTSSSAAADTEGRETGLPEVLTVLRRRLRDLRPDQIGVRLPQSRNSRPFLAVPPLEVGARNAAVIIRRGLHRRDQSREPELVQPGLVEVEVRQSPLHLRAGDRQAELLDPVVHGLGEDRGLDYAAVIVHGADARLVDVALTALVDRRENVLDHREVPPDAGEV